ncbi:MAG: 2-hydroxyacid dehydrogenase [Oscillospiraceae bacterium]|nr:2-hydroxyacid dehydrogenase [Oscillospiraceae bacterium]
MDNHKIVILTDTSIPTERVMDEDVQTLLKQLEPWNPEIVYVRDQKGWTRKQFVEYASEMEKKGADAMQQCDELIESAKDAEIILANFAPVGSSVINAAKKLKFIGVTRSGAENVAIDAATEKGIKVCVAPGRLAAPVADYTVGMILAETRNIARSSITGECGKWNSGYPVNYKHVRCLQDRVVGIVGFGMIGREVGKRLKAFGCHLIAYDPFCPPNAFEENDCKQVSLEELMSTADIVTVHARLSKETEGLVSKEMIGLMKPSAFFVNTARAGLVDEMALTQALSEHRIAGAALDVFSTEPLPEDHPLTKLDNVTLTPHRAGGTSDLAALSYRILLGDVLRYLNGQALKNSKN